MMKWTAKHFDNIYLLTDEQPNLTNDLVVFVSPEDKTVVVEHQVLNYEVNGIRTKVLWCYEPGTKLAGKSAVVYMGRYSGIEINDDFYLPIDIRNNG